MAILNDNLDYLVIDGVNFSSLRREITFTPNIETADVSAGSGITWREFAEGLKTVDMTIFIGYPSDATLRAQVLNAVKPGTHNVIYGPEGSTTGKPKFQGDFIFTGAPTTSNHEKTEGRGFTVAAKLKAAPTSDFWSATF